MQPILRLPSSFIGLNYATMDTRDTYEANAKAFIDFSVCTCRVGTAEAESKWIS